MKATLLVLLSAVAGVSCLISTRGSPSADAAEAHPSSACSGCGGHGHRDAPMSRAEIAAALSRFAHEPMTSDSPALETLLYHGEETRRHLDTHGATLDAERRAFLDRELARTDAEVSLRIVDVNGDVRARVTGARVRLGEKAHLVGETGGLREPVEFNGTVLRVGLHHLWSRY